MTVNNKSMLLSPSTKIFVANISRKPLAIPLCRVMAFVHAVRMAKQSIGL